MNASSPLQKSKSGKQASQNNGQSVGTSHLESHAGPLLSTVAGASRSIRVDRVRGARRAATRGGSLRLVRRGGTLRAAWVLLLAVGLAGIGGAGVLALDNPLCADEVGQAEGVL